MQLRKIDDRSVKVKTSSTFASTCAMHQKMHRVTSFSPEAGRESVVLMNRSLAETRAALNRTKKRT
jgi:hypothetical protein